MRFSQADVACASQVKAAHILRQCPLDTCALGILLGKGFSLFSCSGGLQSFVLGLGAHGHTTPGRIRASTLLKFVSLPREAFAARRLHSGLSYYRMNL